MYTVNIHEAKTNLSRLIELAAKGEPFIIAKAGKPIVKVMRIDAPEEARRLGFLKNELIIPADFNNIGNVEIEDLFGLNK